MKFERGRSPSSAIGIGEIANAEEAHCMDVSYKCFYEKKIPKDKRYPANWRDYPRDFPDDFFPYSDNQYSIGSFSLVHEAFERVLENLSNAKWGDFEEYILALCKKMEEKNRKEEKKPHRKKWGKITHIEINHIIVQVSSGEYGTNHSIGDLSGRSLKYRGKLYLMPDFFEKNPENIFLSREV